MSKPTPPLHWGKLLNHWHDEQPIAHLMRSNGAPACGVTYYASTGPYPSEIPESAKCARCLRIEGRKR